MRSHSVRLCAAVVAAAACIPFSGARATDGHFLHGVGAVNAAMGGFGVAAPTSLLGAFYVNPAGLLDFKGTSVELGFELFKPARDITSTAGPMTGATTSSSEFVPIPAFGWSRELRDDRLVFGVGGLGIGGFGVDYQADTENPITAPRPNGFGQIYSNFSLMKIAPAIALRVNDRVRLGFAVNIDWASLAVDPMPVAAPAVDAGTDGVMGTADDRAYYSSATDADGSFGMGFQAGLQFAVTPSMSVGLAYTSPQWFQKFEYDAVYENPNLPNYNTPRQIEFAMDVPAVYGAGVSFSVNPRVYLGVDAKLITYGSTRGFKESGYAADGSVKGFGWEDIWSVATGLQYMATPDLALRLGYNYSGNPIPDELSMFNAPAPAVVQHHVTLGAGYRFRSGFGLDVAFYRAFENSVEGPFQTMAGPMAGTSVKSTLSEYSILMGFSFNPPRR